MGVGGLFLSVDLSDPERFLRPVHCGKIMSKAYFEAGGQRALELGNRGPIEFDGAGNLAQHIREAYWKHGFYVFEGVVGADELEDLRADFKETLERAPCNSKSSVDSQGRPALGHDMQIDRPVFQFARPLSDPMGGTGSTGGRYQVKMAEHEPPKDAPKEVVLQIAGNLELMDSCLRLYGHPELLRITEEINGADFTPFTDALWFKPAGLGAAVAWHQDGTTHWNNPDLDAGTHGFNFMAQLYPTTPENALWIMPGMHDQGQIEIKDLIDANGGSDELPEAVPLICNAGDVALCNRQMLHCSFPNRNGPIRATFVFGFHRRASVIGVEPARWGGKVRYDEERIYQRSRTIPIAIDARQQRFPDEEPYVYQPLAHEVESNRLNDDTRRSVLHNYNQRDLGI